MSTVKLTWVVDDEAAAPLRSEHGYALWVETAAGRVLFDTGGSGETLLHNLSVLGLNPETLDAVVLSHGHDDHTGGLAALAEHLSPGTPVVAHPTLFRARYSRHSGDLEHRGIPVTQASLEDSLTFRFSRDPVQVLPGVWTTGEVQPRPEPEGRSRWHFIAQGDGLVPDPYEDDLSLVLDIGSDRLVLVCGCCHAGLLNTLATVRRNWSGKIVSIVGGVHLANAPQEVIGRVVDMLGGMSGLRHLWLGHCSGRAIGEAASVALQGVIVEARTAGHSVTYEDGDSVCA
ncbi:MAG: MBL fold metallo-hydrolase [Anaerolineae bacterium]|nr:MBL fold metallo-hydrolase [Anaerolineae bacterium]